MTPATNHPSKGECTTKPTLCFQLVSSLPKGEGVRLYDSTPSLRPLWSSSSVGSRGPSESSASFAAVRGHGSGLRSQASGHGMRARVPCFIVHACTSPYDLDRSLVCGFSRVPGSPSAHKPQHQVLRTLSLPHARTHLKSTPVTRARSVGTSCWRTGLFAVASGGAKG